MTGARSGLDTVDYLVDKQTGMGVPLRQQRQVDKKAHHKHWGKRQKSMFDGPSFAKKKLSIDVQNEDEGLPRLSHMDVDKGPTRQ